MDRDYLNYLKGKSRDELLSMVNSIDKDKYPERYAMALERFLELEKLAQGQGSPIAYDGEYASVLTRFGAIIIDGLLSFVFYLPLLIISVGAKSGIDIPTYFPILFILLIIGMIIFTIWNTIVRMGKTGQSLGRKFLNIAVLNDQGNPIGIGKAFLREIIGRWISGLICYIGYLNAFWDSKKQMWHDKLANCYVYYVDENFS